MPNPNYILSRQAVTRLEEKHPVFQIQAALNPYFGCSNNCVYCPFVARNKVGIKTDFPALLEAKLSKEKKPIPLGIGTACEPYCEEESEYHLTRNSVEIAARYRMPVQIFTKSELILKDAAMLSEYSQEGILAVTVSVFSPDRKLTRRFEPNVIDTRGRMGIVRKLKDKGIFAGIALAPVIPYISDGKDDIEEIFSRAKQSGADYILPLALNMQDEKTRQRMDEQFTELFPDSKLGLQSIYGRGKLPDDVYSSWMNQYLRILSGKYGIPVYMPLKDGSEGDARINTSMPG